jgi:hypothetical protein
MYNTVESHSVELPKQSACTVQYRRKELYIFRTVSLGTWMALMTRPTMVSSELSIASLRAGVASSSLLFL